MSFRYGLIGKKLGHSFSKKYFTEKFQREGLEDHSYELFELPQIEDFSSLLKNEKDLKGLNVTIPYKEEVLQYLDELDDAVKTIKAVNTIKIRGSKLKGYNTDVSGFTSSLKETIGTRNITGALILGTGGASKAVQFALDQLNIPFSLVSRNKNNSTFVYDDINKNGEIFQENNLIINTTPLGMFPAVEQKPPLPYHFTKQNHIFFDLVYNPEMTSFLNEGARYGATVKNGLDMLHYQAEHAWKIWNTNDL